MGKSEKVPKASVPKIITREMLVERQAELQAQLEQLFADGNALKGALLETERLIQLLDDK